MQDNQDNTFPIPATTPKNDQVGGSTLPPVNDTPPLTPPVQPDPVNQPQPVQPDWASQATQDASQLPAGTDNFALNTPSQPGLDATTNPTQDLNLPTQQPLAEPPLTPPADPFSTSPTTPDANTYPIPNTEPAPPSTSEPSAPIPLENTLDLSGQNVPLEPAPAAPPTPADQSGILQPGVDINPGTGLPPVEGEAQTPSLDTLPTDFGDSNNAIAANAASADTKKKFPPKIMLIAGGALGFIVIISIVLVIVSRSQRKPAVDLNQAQVDQTQNATDNTTTTPAAIPEGFKKVDRDCYSFGVFLPTTVDFAKTSCKINAKFGSTSQYIITVTPVTETVTGLQSLVDQAKVGTISSQEDIKLGGFEAKQVIQKVNGLDQQSIVVIPTGKNYQLDGKAVTGFIITTSFNDDTAKKASETLVSTWAWK